MKNIVLFLSLAVFSITCKAQGIIDGFIGLKFGDSKEKVIAELKQMGVTVLPKDIEERTITAHNVKFGNNTAETLTVRFYENQVYEGIFYFTAELESKTVDLYNAIKKNISLVYGEGSSYKIFESPYKERTGDEIAAIKDAKAEYATFWEDENKPIKNYLSLLITNYLVIRLDFQDSALIAKVRPTGQINN